MSIFGVRYNSIGQTSYYVSDEQAVVGEYLIVEGEQGVKAAEIVSGPLALLPGSTEADLPKALRRANAEDLETEHNNRLLAKEAIKFCNDCIHERKLNMKLVDVEIFFDRSKYIFYFTSPNRIDFRDLVKDLVREYRARIELRQIGVRHETQLLGGIGNCGRICCCKQHLRKFAPVTIKMAKEQNLFLNPAKISGMCGRLLCCLYYEQDTYEAFHREAPRPGKKYQTDKGLMRVNQIDMFSNSIRAVNEKNEEIAFALEDWRSLNPRKPAGEGRNPAPDLVKGNQIDREGEQVVYRKNEKTK